MPVPSSGAKARDEWREVRMSDERAGFLSTCREESEERIEQDFDLHEQIRGVPRGYDPLVAGRKPEKGRQ